ncbi:protein-methionine-sulfoxide reductase heme-binding subunit MsrQ [Rhizobium sp. 9140]|uniref:protein-methionine-sulfoxide reductase heme-binding subunit MsrQ n=1 Tax=Rhizobium sp. 9140 TaxID=1761900 RepID=UPI00079A1725|nr:protein-methionine-sulfoxide reductase heme-binding subunit MsrQ [Rhizobium sp. 9140]CZT37123.1 sulfoxide reductase heme-binding subunit YedZ [Rhizobium sp. 9140]
MISSFALPKRWQPASVWGLYFIGLLPAGWTFYLGATDQLGADAIKTFELFLGLWAVRFLLLTLAITPLRDLFGWNYLRYRRALGLLCFYYALMHLTVYIVLDQALEVQTVINDVLRRPFIMFGMAGFVMLLMLAVTSNTFAIRRLGKKWIWLHRLISVVAASSALHFALSTKILSLEQFIYIGLLIAMILYRAYRPIMMERRRVARKAGTASR